MDLLIFLLLSLAISPASFMAPPTVIDVGGDQKDIPEINKGLNLREGDIVVDSSELQRSAILSPQSRWDGYVPYVLNESLSMNSKGVILRAFENLRLKACVDFKPRTTEENYVSVEFLTGCWSYIGKIGGQQRLSIGDGCGYISVVEHEFFHALGFYHEQSRYDRDDYVTINFENIIAGLASNFDKIPESASTTLGTPYDYTSVMHYGQDAFTNGSGHTIITKVSQYQNVIGQRYDLSPLDAFELSKLYNCSSSISFLDHCSFDNYSICEMSTCSNTSKGWEMASNVSGGPFSDHSNLPSIGVPVVSMNNNSQGPSSFMHFSTQNGQEGDSGRLMSKRMTPRRNCNVQCLQFFYYHSGSKTDQLNIWIREYQTDTDTVGTLRIMDQITGPPTNYWQIRYVPLNAEKAFSVEFEARKGAGVSGGGFSVDDINLSESECPHGVWQIRNFTGLLNTSNPGSYIFSPAYYSPDGYRYQAMLRLDQTLSIYVRLVSGVYDDQLQWPCPWRQVTFTLLDQTPNIQQRMSLEYSLTTDPTQMNGGKSIWGKPSEVGYATFIGTESVNVTNGMGYPGFMETARLDDREFVKGSDLILLINMQDISALKQNNSLSCPKVPAKNFNVSPYQGAQEGSCSAGFSTRPPPANTAETPSTTINLPVTKITNRTTTTASTTSNNRPPPANMTVNATTTKNLPMTKIPNSTKPTFPRLTTDDDRECLDFFCSGVNIIHPSVALLLALVLLAVN